MKVQVNFKVDAKTSGPAELFKFTASPTETVMAFKERIATAQSVIFPDQDLLLNGEVLADELKLSDCGVKESSRLDFVVRASEESVVKQFMELLLTCALSFDELGMLYCYKYGESVSHALKIVGCDEKLEDFLKKQKVFQVENGRAALAQKETYLPPPSVQNEANCRLEDGDQPGVDEMASMKEKEQAADSAATVIQSARRAQNARRDANTKRAESAREQKIEEASEHPAAKHLQKEAALATRMGQVFKQETLVFRDSRKAFQDALEELEAEESNRRTSNLVFRESRKAFQDALEDLEMEESRRFIANEGFKKMVFRETHLAIHLALEEIERSLQ